MGEVDLHLVVLACHKNQVLRLELAAHELSLLS